MRRSPWAGRRPHRRRRLNEEKSLAGSQFMGLIFLLQCILQMAIVWFTASSTIKDRSKDDVYGNMVCVYHISGQYGLLPRILFYVTFAFGVILEKYQYLVVGALVSAMTFAGLASIHVLLLAFLSKEPGFDLDTIACACILNTSSTIAIWELMGTRQVESGVRLMLRLWAVLTAIGSIAGMTTSVTTRAPENVCQTEQGLVLTTPNQYDASLYNCTYKCFSGSNHFREHSEILAIHMESTFPTYIIVLAMVSPIVGSIWFAMLSSNAKKLNRTLRYALGNIPFLAVILVWELLIIGPYAPARQNHQQLPYSEAYFAVGQWAPWVVAGLVLIAALTLTGKGESSIVWYEGGNDRTRVDDQAIPLTERPAVVVADEEEDDDDPERAPEASQGASSAASSAASAKVPVVQGTISR